MSNTESPDYFYDSSNTWEKNLSDFMVSFQL